MVWLKLSAQVEDMDINGTVEALKIIAKCLFNNLCPAENPAWFLGENSQQLEFNRGKINRLVGKKSLVFKKVQGKLTMFDFIGTALAR